MKPAFPDRAVSPGGRAGSPGLKDRRGMPLNMTTRTGMQMTSNQSALMVAERSFDFTEKDFNQVRKLIHAHAGISLSPSKRQMVYSRLGRRLRALGLERFADYLRLLEDGDESEWQAFTNALTTNLTAFFRESHHFPALAEHVAALPRSRKPEIWCCASSTGEEPYSIAITLAEHYGSLSPPVRILATDVDTNVLGTAERGVYRAEAVEHLPAAQVRRYFLRGTGGNADKVKVRPELQSLISFRRVNLLEASWPVRGPLDAIFCRNIMIYFDKPTQHVILERFVPLLGSDGLLFVGHSESLAHASDLFRLRGKTVYELASRRRGGHDHG